MSWRENDPPPSTSMAWLRRIPPWVLDLVIAAIIVAAGFTSFPEEQPADSPAAVFLAVVPALFLPLRRRWPFSIMIACLAFFSTATFVGTLTPGILFATGVAMFGVATRFPRRVTLVAVIASTVIVMLVTMLAGAASGFDRLTIQVAIFIAFTGVAGDATRSRREYLQAMTDRVLRAESARESEARRRVAEERLRIARDLHDTVAHQIAVISLNAAVADAAMDERPEKARLALGTIRTASRTVLTEISDLLHMLRTSTDSDDVDSPAPQPGLSQLNDLITLSRELGLTVEANISGYLNRLSPAADLVAYRAVQESLTNAHKHGIGNRATLTIHTDAHDAVITITNPVRAGGYNESRFAFPAGVGGNGLLGLRERVASVRGTMMQQHDVETFQVTITIPLTKEA